MKIIRLLPKYLGYGACVVLLALILLTIANSIGRYFFHFPITGTTEIGSYMLLLIVALGLGGAAIERKHIKVDLVMDRLPKRAQFIIDAVMLSVSIVLLAIMTWVNGRQALLFPTRYTSVLKIPDTPFRWVFTVGFGLCCLGALVLLIEHLKKRGKDGS